MFMPVLYMRISEILSKSGASNMEKEMDCFVDSRNSDLENSTSDVCRKAYLGH